MRYSFIVLSSNVHLTLTIYTYAFYLSERGVQSEINDLSPPHWLQEEEYLAGRTPCLASKFIFATVSIILQQILYFPGH